MPAPYFYFAHLASMADAFALNETSSRHVVQVLRMWPGETLRLTDGKGLSAIAHIRDANKKKCGVEIIERQVQPAPARRVQIALSLLKNAARFEWFLEKATELGVSEIVPLKSARTEKQQFRLDRMQGILESALIQSQQVWMPVLQQPQVFEKWIAAATADQKFIAHCVPGTKQSLSGSMHNHATSPLILIGPEGDFTDEELKLAMENNFVPVSLGDHRLRSETAAVAAAAVMMLV